MTIYLVPMLRMGTHSLRRSASVSRRGERGAFGQCVPTETVGTSDN
ncbi:MAG: hypothetical protein K8R46_01590 [Pirellulales bacterium]|nr:hypothetical protein [Pirellulales bacterium]